MRSRVTGSTSALSTVPVAVSTMVAMISASGRMSREPGRVHGGRVAGQDQGGRVHLGDDRGPADHVVGPQRGAVVDRGVHPTALDEDRMGVARRRWPVAALQGDRRDRRPRPRHRRAGVDQLVVHGEQEREEPLVLGVERGRERRRGPAPRRRSGSRSPARGSARPPGTRWSAARRARPARRAPHPPRPRARRGSRAGRRVEVGEASQHGAGRLAARRRRRVAQRAQHARRRRHDHRPRPGQPAQARWRATGPRRRTRRGRTRGDRSPAAPTPGAGRRACSR